MQKVRKILLVKILSSKIKDNEMLVKMQKTQLLNFLLNSSTAFFQLLSFNNNHSLFLIEMIQKSLSISRKLEFYPSFVLYTRF